MSASAPLIYSYIDTDDAVSSPRSRRMSDASDVSSSRRRLDSSDSTEIGASSSNSTPHNVSKDGGGKGAEGVGGGHHKGRVTIKVCTPYSKTVKLLKIRSTVDHSDLQSLLDHRFGFRVKIT
jgi:hypothetical protein